MYAIMLETDYMKKDKFHQNFWAGFKQVLGKNHVIKDLRKCDFRPIYEHLMAEREKKKAMTKEVSIFPSQDPVNVSDFLCCLSRTKHCKALGIFSSSTAAFHA